MKERPILFSGPMVRAILEGRKTQTRRVVKPQPGPIELAHPWEIIEACKYGKPGDRLWVRETWKYCDWTEDGDPYIRYDADKSKHLIFLRDIHHECANREDKWNDRLIETWAELSKAENTAIDGVAADRKWRPSIHMPRWASRITLRITGIRCERLGEISEADALAEGIIQTRDGGWAADADGRCYNGKNARISYFMLWEVINGEESLMSNPLVWAIEFEPIRIAHNQNN